MSESNVECGDVAICKVTKIQGVVVVRHDYLYGVARVGIQPEGSCEGKPHETLHIDLPQAMLVSKEAVSRDGMIADSAVKLGDRCRDKISGFVGICTGSAEWLYACTKICLQPETISKKENKPDEHVWFDEPQLSVVKEKVIKEKSKFTGGFDKPTSSGPTVSRN